MITNKQYAHFTDEQLLQQYQLSQQQQLLASLFLRYHEMVYGVCLKYLQESESAKDAVMAIYEELQKKVAKHEVVNFKSWLYVLSKNYCLMQLRKKQVKLVSSNEENFVQLAENMHPNMHTDDLMIKETQLQLMENCLQQLQSEQQQAVRLFFLEEKCYQEIAHITGFEWSKVRSLLQNGKRNLKICMDKNAA